MDIKHVFNRARPRSSDPQSIRERANQSMQDTAKRLKVIEVIVLTVSVIVFQFAAHVERLPTVVETMQLPLHYISDYYRLTFTRAN